VQAGGPPGQQPVAPISSCRRILCFGDSLTCGYSGNISKPLCPYGRDMEQALRHAGIDAKVSICGLSGINAKQMAAEIDSPVCFDMYGQTGKGVGYLLDDEGPFDLVILMAGTNDVGLGTSPLIRDNICILHSACHARGVPTLMIAPPHAIGHLQRELCSCLQEWAVRNPSMVMGFVNSEEVLPRFQRGHWEPDDVHFTAAGAATLGKHLASIVANILQRLKPKSSSVLRQESRFSPVQHSSTRLGREPATARHPSPAFRQAPASARHPSPAFRQVTGRSGSPRPVSPLGVRTSSPPASMSRTAGTQAFNSRGRTGFSVAAPPSSPPVAIGGIDLTACMNPWSYPCSAPAGVAPFYPVSLTVGGA
jgi:lysophospholipase L1-like esterase